MKSLEHELQNTTQQLHVESKSKEEADTRAASLQAQLDDISAKLWEANGDKVRLGLAVQDAASIKSPKDVSETLIADFS